MRRLIVIMALLSAVAVPPAIAQSGGGSSGQSSAGNKTGAVGAPVGHRQPRSGDVPSEKNLSDPNNPANREDAALDRKIKSICRGC